MMPFDPTWFTASSILLWVLAMLFFIFSKRNKLIAFTSHSLFIAGIGVLSVFAVLLWQELGRAPLRTLGETRLWYALFLSLIGYATYLRWNYRWVFYYSGMMAVLFLGINLASPENYDKTLMPALQSVWFVPHVIVYIFAYAILAVSALVAIKGLFTEYFRKDEDWSTQLADNMVYLGLGFLTLGLLFGALWGKEAWGHYWTWDPKETWAFLTWIGYTGYIHFRYHKPSKVVPAMWMLALAFVVLLICWFGVNYLPSAVNSVHSYTS